MLQKQKEGANIELKKKFFASIQTCRSTFQVCTNQIELPKTSVFALFLAVSMIMFYDSRESVFKNLRRQNSLKTNFSGYVSNAEAIEV